MKNKKILKSGNFRNNQNYLLQNNEKKRIMELYFYGKNKVEKENKNNKVLYSIVETTAASFLVLIIVWVIMFWLYLVNDPLRPFSLLKNIKYFLFVLWIPFSFFLLKRIHVSEIGKEYFFYKKKIAPLKYCSPNDVFSFWKKSYSLMFKKKISKIINKYYIIK